MATTPSIEEKPANLGLTRSASDEDAVVKDGGVPHRDYAPPSRITNRCLWLMTSICAGGFLFGYDIGVISGVLIMKNFVLRFGGFQTEAGGWELPTQTQSLLTATLSAGTFFGALTQAPVSDWIGRQRSMVVWSILFTLGAVVQTSTEDSEAQFVIGRVMAGFAVGALSGLCPLYLGETAPKAIRGIMVSGYQLMIIFGITLSYAIGWGSSHAVESSASWRIPVGLQMLWGLILITLVFNLPESPRWKLQRSDINEARRIMASMRGIDLVDGRGDLAMEEELKDMEHHIELEREHFAGTNFFTAYFKCFSREAQLWRRTLQGMLLQTLQQLNGQNFYYYYGPVFFQSANVQLNAYAIQFILGAVSLGATVPCLYSSDKLGRRKSLIIGSVACGTCAFIVAFVGKYALPGATGTAPGAAFIAFAVIHLFFFSSMWGAVPWIYLSESFPQHVRAKCVSLGSASNWFWNFLVSWFSPGLADPSHYGPFILLIFGSVTYFAGIFVYFVLPETRGLSLEQVDEMYKLNIAPWKSASWVPTVGDPNRDTLLRGVRKQQEEAKERQLA